LFPKGLYKPYDGIPEYNATAYAEKADLEERIKRKKPDARNSFPIASGFFLTANIGHFNFFGAFFGGR
jgi:hypothetical protein